MRNTFIDELVLQAETNEKVALVVGDLGYSVVEPFAEKFPERFINAGVAEQNMMGLAAGMASEGYHVFVYSIANFPTFRCAEQIRNDVAYHNLPVTVVAVGGGLAYGNLGYSHHAIQDYALIRVMPNMLIAAPGDPFEVRACISYLIKNPGPSYLRLGKSGEVNCHSSLPNLTPGEWIKVREGEVQDHIILSTGATLTLAIQKALKMKPFSPTVYSLPLWGMGVKHFQSDYVSKFHKVTTLEDHLIDGGFGSWMLESNIRNTGFLNRINPIGLDPVVCGHVGTQLELNVLGGLL